MQNVREIFLKLSYSQIRELFNKHLLWSGENKRTSGKPAWHDEPGTLNVIGIRCNTEVDFNFGKYNDYLVLIYNRPDNSFRIEIIEVTVDPNHDEYRRAHLRQGCWNSYKVRDHRHATRFFKKLGKTIKRWALCQDKNAVEVVRTDGKGKVIDTERGMFGINVHDNGGYVDSGIACTVIQSDDDYLEDFLIYVYDIDAGKPVPVNWDNITYCLMNFGNFEKYINEQIQRVEKAAAGNLLGPSKPGTAVGATRTKEAA